MTLFFNSKSFNSSSSILGLFGHGFLSRLRCRERDDASYYARCGEPLKEGVPRIIYHRRRGEKDEFDEKTDTASRNWVTPLRPPHRHRRGNISPGLLVPRLVGQLGPALAPSGHRIRTLHSVECVEDQGEVPEALLSHSRSQFCISVPDLARSQSRRLDWVPLH